MRFGGIVAVLALLNIVKAESFLIKPQDGVQGTEVGLIWVQGGGIKNQAYKSIAENFVADAGKNGIKAYVGIPDFFFDVPNPLQIDSHIDQIKKDMKAAGFKGDKFYLAAHSLGTVVSQMYTIKHASDFKG